MAITATPVRANARKTTNGFWWANLSTSDATAAATFYERVLGWTYEEMPIGENMVHRSAVLGGHQIAGIDPLMPGSEWPTVWTNYVYVDDLQATCDNVTRLGGTIAMDPMDVMGEGWMAIAIDPTGAAFGIWQPGRHTGADAVNQPSTYTWVELTTSDPEAAMRFYGELFGWGFEKQDVPGMDYWMVNLGEHGHAGIMPKPAEMADAPSMWVTYWGVADIDATVAEITAAGGQVLFPPMKMGPGRGIAAIDPQGGHFHAIQLDEWPAD